MDEILLKEVVKRVLASYDIQKMLSVAKKEDASSQKCYLAFIETEEAIADLPKLKLKFNNKLCLYVAEGLEISDNSLPKVVWEEMKIREKWAGIYIPACSSSQLAQIALGLALDRLSEIVSWGLKNGITIEVGRIDYSFGHATPQEYRNLFIDYLKKVKSYGIIADEEMKRAEPLKREDLNIIEPFKEPLPEKSVHFEKNLLSEKDVVSISENSTLNIKVNTLLTPTAIDILKKRKVKVYREGVLFL